MLEEFRRVGDGAVLNNSPYDVAAAALCLTEGGAVVTDAAGRSLDDRPLLGSGPEFQMSMLCAATPELHAKLLAHIAPRLEGIELRLYEIEGRRYRVPPRFNDVLDRVDELALRFEGTENRLEQLAEQILDLDMRASGVVEGRSRTSH